MKILTAILLLTFFSCNSKNKYFEIDKSIESDLEYNKKVDKMSEYSHGDFSYYIFINEEMEKREKEEEKISQKILLDSIVKMIPNVCQCQLKNDTITVAGGIFYGGGIGYKIQIFKDDYIGKILIGSTSEKFKSSKNGKFSDEIYLNSKEQKLYFTEDPVFELGETIKGKIIMESENYLFKSGDLLKEDNYYMKIIFECKLSEYLAF